MRTIVRSEAATFSTSSGRFGSCCSPGNVSSNRGAQFPSPGIPKRLRSKGVSQSLIRGLFVGSVIRQSPDSFMSHQLVTFPNHRPDIVHNCEHFWPSITAPPVSTMVDTSGGTGKCHTCVTSRPWLREETHHHSVVLHINFFAFAGVSSSERHNCAAFRLELSARKSGHNCAQ